MSEHIQRTDSTFDVIKHCIICGNRSERNNISAHLRKCHQMTIVEYYDKYFLTNADDKICNNPLCTKLVKLSTLRKGYDEFCSQTCSISVRNKRLHQQTEYKLRHKARFSEQTSKLNKIRHQDCNHRKKLTMLAWIGQCKKKNIARGILYVASTEDYVKVGITSSTHMLQIRLARLRNINTSTCFTGSVEDIALNEYLIKTNFSELSLEKGQTERFHLSDYDSILQFIENVKALTLLTTK